MSVPIDITDDTLASSLVPVQCASLAPPALFKKGEEGRKKKDVLHLSRCYTHTHHFVTHNSHTTLSRISFTHNFVTQNSSAQLCHRFLSHTTLSHNPTQLCHTQLFQYTTLSHTHTFVTYISFTHTIFYTQICHVQLFHTQHFYIHKHTHTTLSHTHTALSPNLAGLRHLLSCLPFPSHFHICLVVIGRS